MPSHYLSIFQMSYQEAKHGHNNNNCGKNNNNHITLIFLSHIQGQRREPNYLWELKFAKKKFCPFPRWSIGAKMRQVTAQLCLSNSLTARSASDKFAPWDDKKKTFAGFFVMYQGIYPGNNDETRKIST